MAFNIASILGGGIDKIVDSVGNAIDSLVTSDEEKLILKNKLEEIRLDAKQRASENEVNLEKEITSRWKSDNDHLITRAVRPATVLWVYFLFTVAILFDGNVGEFTINPSYMPLLETVLVTVTIAFFGSRGIEKVTRNIQTNTMEKF